ncbi:MAG: NADH-quinone oxidoreductase subunit J [Actinobacteria bacterium]|nr:NADH-quinone oxidoreductase subunit J [Actinomycetota bacterium]
MVLASDIQVAQNVGFGIIALMMVLAGVGVIASRNVVHAALSLVIVMAGAAAQYVLLAAEFVAVTQVLVYIGAVMVLFLFGVMLTRAKIGKDADLNNGNAAVAAPVALLLFGVMVYVLGKGFTDQELPTSDVRPQYTATISDLIFKPYLLPFWALSFVLLAAVIGAIVLARKD